MENKKVSAEQYEFPFVKNKKLMMAGKVLCEICNKPFKKKSLPPFDEDGRFNVCGDPNCERAAAKFL